MVAALALTLEKQPMQLGLLKEGDWAGIVTMAIGLSAFQTVLEEGEKDDWFASPFIFRLAIVAAVFLGAFIWIELTVKKPLVSLRLLTRRNFGIGVIANVLVGFALFGTVYILPQYLGQAQGYNAEQIGAVLAWTGLPQLLLIPLVPMLMKRFDVRYIAFVGIALFALSCFMNTDAFARRVRRSVLHPQYRARDRPGADHHAGQRDHHRRHRAERGRRRLRPVEHAAQSRRRGRHRDAGDRAGQARAIPFQHHRAIGDAGAGRGEPASRPDDRTIFMAHGVTDRIAAAHEAVVYLGDVVKRQALIMGFSDTFAVIGLLLAVAAIALLFASKPRAAAGAGAH